MECTLEQYTNSKKVKIQKTFLELMKCKLERFLGNMKIEGAEEMSKTK